MMSYKLLVGTWPYLQLWCSWAQRWTAQMLSSRGQGHSERNTLRGIFSHISGMHGRMLIKLVKIAHYTDAVFKVVGSNAKVRRRHATFSENAPFWRRHSDRRFAVECHL